MTISGCYAGVKNYEFLEQETLHQGSLFLGREAPLIKTVAFLSNAAD